MKRIVSSALLSALLTAGAGAQVIPITQSTTDVFDVSQGSIVTGSSGVAGMSVITAAFGASGGDEPGNVLMLDLQAQPFVHWIEWELPAPTRIGFINLFAADDGATSRRSFDAARLFYWNAGAGAWVQVVSYVPPHPYVHQFPQTQMLAQGYFPALPAASRYRAEFDQWQFVPAEGGFIAAYYGPRIMEIDGHPCPADLDGDGVVNSNDFFSFLSVFFSLGPGADFNNDGVIDSGDFFAFLGYFFNGC